MPRNKLHATYGDESCTESLDIFKRETRSLTCIIEIYNEQTKDLSRFSSWLHKNKTTESFNTQVFFLNRFELVFVY